MKFIKYPYTTEHIEELRKIIASQQSNKKNSVILPKSKEHDVMLNQLIYFSKNMKMFHGFNHDEIIATVENVAFTKYPINECPLKEGVANKRMHYIISGEVSVLTQNRVVAILRSGDVFGEISAFFDTKSIATLKANRPTVVISFDIIHAISEENAQALAKLYKYISHNLAKKLYNTNTQR